jgi:hypothetical protein
MFHSDNRRPAATLAVGSLHFHPRAYAVTGIRRA